MAVLVAGVDLGGTNMQIGVVALADGRHDVRSRAKRKTAAGDGVEAVLGRVDSGIREACDAAQVAVSDLGGVGLGAPGVVDDPAGVVRVAVNLGWRDVPAGRLLGERLGLPVRLCNDVNAALVGEHFAGAGRGAGDLLGVWLGTGVGGALILGGRIHEGHFGSAGEIGHTVVNPSNPSGWRTLEDNCSRTAVVERLRLLMRRGRESVLAGAEIKAAAIGEAYRAGDALAVEVIHETADLLGVAVANAVTLLSLERVVLGGGLAEAVGRPLADRVAASMRREVFPDACREVPVVLTELEDNAGVLGAALAAAEGQR
jgi:glucokinase